MLFVGVWTAASMLHSIAGTVIQLAAFRFLLGIGEAGNWPGAAKAVAEWFPIRERAFAMAIFNSGSTIGAVIAPPIIVWVALTYGWRKAFFIGAGLSALLMIAWYFFCFTPERHPKLSVRELDTSDRDRAGMRDRVRRAGRGCRSFKHRQLWAVIAARFLTDPIWWFLISRLPNYLKSERGVDLRLIGLLAWIPFLFADIGTLSGGAISSLLIKRGWSVNAARKVVLITSMALVPVGVATIVLTRADTLAIAGISVIAFSFQGWIANIHTIPSDCFPKQDVGSVFGIGGTAAGLSSMLFTLVVGYVVDRFSYTPVYVMVGVMGPLGATLFLLIMRRIERVPELEPGR